MAAALGAVRTWALTSSVCAAFDGVAIWLALTLLDVPLAPAVGMLTFVLAFVPLIGALAAGLVAVLVTLAFSGPGAAVAVLAVALVVQQLDGTVLAPILLGRGFKLHPTTVLLLTLLGGSVLGVTGMVFAVPFTGAVLTARSSYLASLRRTAPVRPEEAA